MDTKIIMAVVVGGGVGSLGRYLFASQVMRLVGGNFPFGTLAVNVLGSFVMGLFVELFALRWNVGLEMRTFLTVGFLGGFTTFSAFSLDAALLIERGEWMTSLAYALGSVVLSIAALFIALYLVRTFAS